MATLVSPGVSVTITDESQYGSSGPGTVPLLIIASAQDKLQPGSTTAIAPGSTKANAGKLYLVTSQRDALQTFGAPTFYSAGGSVQYGNQLNEVGLFTLYEYLGIANQAYVIRADLNLSQLVPSSAEPTGPVSNGQNWLDLSMTTWGMFRSNGNPNPAFSWQPRKPIVIQTAANLEKIAQGQRAVPLISGSGSAITGTGSLSLVINGITILPAPATGDSITTIASKINGYGPISAQGITAVVYSRTEKVYLTNPNTQAVYGATADVYNLRLVRKDVTASDINLSGTTQSVLDNLGLVEYPDNVVLPASTLGAVGDYAVNTLTDDLGNYKNQMWEKISLVTTSGSASYWFKLGSTDDGYPGWGWREAAPRVLAGSVPNPTLTANDVCTIKIGTGSTLTVTVPNPASLTGFRDVLNAAFDSISANAMASINTVGTQNYLKITNFSGTSITINDLSDQYGVTGHPFRTCGILPVNTYWGSVTGTTALTGQPFDAAILDTKSATVVNPGSAYEVGDTLTVLGGTHTTQSVLTVTSLTVVSVAVNAVGANYSVNEKLTFNGANYTTSVILNVDAIDQNGGITQLSIYQAGQFTGTPAPKVAVSPYSTSGHGINVTVDIVWGVDTVDVAIAGSYSLYPDMPVNVTGGNGSAATFDLTYDWLQSSTMAIDPGTGPVIVHAPAAPDNTLDGLINEINTIAFPNGPIVASKVTVGNSNYLKITNTNGTAFTVEDVRGQPLATAGIAAGVTFGRQLVYQGYQPTLTVPSDLASLASENVWINTTPGNQGAHYVVKQYINGVWSVLNTRPNTGTVPMYASTSVADAAFGSLKAIGSVFVEYNSDGDSPAEANHVLQYWTGSSWQALTYTPSSIAPTGPAVDGTLWYNTALRVDIMVNDGLQWLGYREKYPATDINGPILDSAAPTVQSNGAPLVDYDLWVDTAVKPYPAIYRYSAATTEWILIDNTDQVNSSGIIFADARANSTGLYGGSELQSDMVLNHVIDPDAPDALLYPAGMLLFNTRYSTNNVKVYRKNYFPTLTWKDRWVTYSGNNTDGTPYMGSAAQRIVVVNALQSVLAANQEARAESTYFNLLATPGYVECLDEMITLNTDKKEVAFIVGDSPADLEPTGTAFVNWANNTANAADNGSSALISSSPYAGVYYPWGLGTNLDGTSVLVPPSLIALRTLAYNDQVAYPWFAPAGFNRGLVTGVSSVGYLTSEGDYQPVTLNQGQRDVLYTNKINPIAYIPGRGLVVYGQKTLNPVSSALDRINVARLINYLKYQLDNLAKPFLFEQNDSVTRKNVTAVFSSFMQNLVKLRALYDFAVICDSSNNTSDRIDRNELWIDIAIKPEKSIEFIYIPIRVLNTGAPLPGGSA